MSRSDAIDPPDTICECTGIVEVDWITGECKQCGYRASLKPHEDPEPDEDRLQKGLREYKQVEAK